MLLSGGILVNNFNLYRRAFIHKSYCKRPKLENEANEVMFEPLPFDHPLYIMYSSGTTGKPKSIVHSAGGTLIQHLKEHVLHVDLKRKEKIFYYT